MSHSSPTQTPPKWANRLLEWYCRPEVLEDLQGDLHEFFDRNVEEKGLRKARLNFVLDVFKFMRPYTVRKLEILNNITTTIMFKNYFKTSLRSIARNKLFSAINIIGLAISMSVCLLMIALFAEVKSYDRFHENAHEIYRFNTIHQWQENDPSHFASTSILAGKRFKEEVPGFEVATIINRGLWADAQIGDLKLPLEGLYVDEDFFKVLSFELIRGNKETALLEPYSIVLTDETATKFFKDKDPLNEIIELDEKPYKVTGVVKKPPFNSHMKFTSLVSLSTYETELREEYEDDRWLNWRSIWSNYVYFRVNEQTDLAQLEARMANIAEEENAKSEHSKANITFQPLTGIMTGSQDLSNQLGESMGSTLLWFFGALAFIVILSAAFNYTNLSIARSLRRAKEVGVRKVVGATKGQVFTQFIIEACIISIGSLLLAYGLFYVIRPLFLNLNPEIQNTLRLEHPPILFVWFILFALLVGFMAGFLPSIFLSKLKAISTLKDASGTRLFSKIGLRKVLIVIQFTLSLAFIISASIAFRQYQYAMNFDLGFNTENVLNVDIHGNDPQLAKAVFEAIPEITDISTASHILSVGSRWANEIFSDDRLDSASVYFSGIDHNYLRLMEHKLIAGSNFPERDKVDKEESLIVNEATLKRFNLGTPEEAVGKFVQMNDNRLMIRGVVENFNYATIEAKIENFGFRHMPQDANVLNLKISTNDLIGTRQKIEAAWNEFDPVHEFEGSFYDDRIEEAYAEFSVTFTIIGFLAFLTISIAALGLLGMGVYTAETKLKEISIRKVLGASEGTLVKLLSKSFMWLLVIASAIAIPATYFVFDQVILVDNAYRAPIGLPELFLGVIIIFSIGFITIGSQTWKAAKSNPAQTLRAE